MLHGTYPPLHDLFSPEKPGSFEPGQRYLALPWSFVSKITNSKHPAKKDGGQANYK
jgi:hypothetical protein